MNAIYARLIRDVAIRYPAVIPLLSLKAQRMIFESENSWKADLAGRDEYERKLERVLRKKFSGQLNRIMEILGDPPDIANLTQDVWDAMEAELRAAIMPVLLDIAITHAEVVLNTSPVGVDWALVNRAAMEWAGRHTDDVIRGIITTSRRATIESWNRFFSAGGTVGQSVQEFFETTGMGIGDLQNAFAPYFGDVRARMIAVTETTRAAVEGERVLVAEIEAANPSIHMVEIWQTSNDESVCEICSPLNGREIGDGWTAADGPPAHVNCRCWTNHEMRLR